MSGYTPGNTYVLAEQLGSTATATGMYAWTATAEIDYTVGSPVYEVATGIAPVVVATTTTTSPFGAGWGGPEELYSVSAGGTTGVMWVSGDGSVKFYESTASGYVSPAGDLGTLATSGSGFQYTASDQTEYDFSLAAGYTNQYNLTEIASANGQTNLYQYAGSELTLVKSADGSTATFAYSSAAASRSTIRVGAWCWHWTPTIT